MTPSSRLAKLRSKLEEKGIEALLVSQPENRRYLSGFTGSDGYLFISRDTAVLATDFRYVEQAQKESPGFELFQIQGELKDWLPKLPGLSGIKRLGFEPEHISFDAHRRFSDALGGSGLNTVLAPTCGLVEELRMVKDADEIELICRAVTISDIAIESIARRIRPGVSELEIAWLIEESMRSGGSQPLPFDIILASGPNAALPHATPSHRRIGRGEPVVIDIGARFEGYVSDITRTICVRPADDRFKEIYNIVLAAQQAAITGISAGITGAQADSLARNVISASGYYGDCFGHGTGHGVGLAVHEKPSLNPRSNDILADGTVFTIEPGIYIPGWGGIRIEDTVALENGKIRVLSQAAKLKEFS